MSTPPKSRLSLVTEPHPAPEYTLSPQEQWSAVEAYTDGALIGPDPVLDAVRAASAEAGLPDIAVSPGQGRLLFLLAKMHRARRILELGTLGGYSTVCLARALPADGRLVTIEVDPHHFAVAQANLTRAGVSSLVDQRMGVALEMLPKMEARDRTPFDFIFIDADKESSADYFTGSLRLSRPGTVILIDNTVREGAVADAASTDPRVQGIRRLNQAIAAERRVIATTVQTVGSKGYDGFTLAMVMP